MKLPTRELTTWTYILEDERDLDEAEQTRWLLRPLTFHEDTVLVNRISNNLGAGDTAKLALEAGLEGWENLTGEDGEPVEVQTKTRKPLGKNVRTVTTALLDLIPSKVRHELATAIIEHGRLKEDDEKN